MLISASVCLSRVMRPSFRKRHGLSIVQHQKRIAGSALAEARLRCVEALIRELEGAMVDCDAGPGGQDLVCSYRLFGTHMDGRHEPARLIRSDWQERQARRSEPLPDLGEMRSECCVSREIHHLFLTFDHISAPERLVVVA